MLKKVVQKSKYCAQGFVSIKLLSQLSIPLTEKVFIFIQLDTEAVQTFPV
jgi:hypothetical protein